MTKDASWDELFQVFCAVVGLALTLRLFLLSWQSPHRQRADRQNGVVQVMVRTNIAVAALGLIVLLSLLATGVIAMLEPELRDAHANLDLLQRLAVTVASLASAGVAVLLTRARAMVIEEDKRTRATDGGSA